MTRKDYIKSAEIAIELIIKLEDVRINTDFTRYTIVKQFCKDLRCYDNFNQDKFLKHIQLKLAHFNIDFNICDYLKNIKGVIK